MKAPSLSLRIFEFVTFFMGGFFILAPSTWASTSLIHHWSFDENTGLVAHDTTGSTDGTLTNSPLWETGKFENALRFDGADDKVDLGNIDLSGDAMTISVWVNVDDFITQPEGRILAKSDAVNGQSHYWMLSTYKYGSRYVPRFRLKTQSHTTAAYGSGPSGSAGMQTGQWYHIVATYDGSMMRVYIDGIEMGSRAKTGSIDEDSSIPAAIGDLPHGSRPFDGLIDDMCFYDTALTAQEVSDLYEGGVSCGEAAPPVVPPAPAWVKPNGPNPQMIVVGNSYVELGGEVLNSQSPDPAEVTINSSHVDTSSVGTYFVYYSIVDPISGYTQSARVVEVVEATSPIHHWTFDENIGSVANDTAGSVHGTLINGPTWEVGKLSNALRFDGNDDLVSLGNLDLSGNTMTISAWINADDFVAHPEGRILAKSDSISGDDHYWMISTIKSGNKYVPRFRLKTGSSTTTLYGDGSQGMQTGQWYHIVATYDGSYMRIFQDGIEVGALPKSGNIAQDSSVPAAIGDLPNGSRPFDGLIDDVCVFDSALSQGKISLLYNGGAGVLCDSFSAISDVIPPVVTLTGPNPQLEELNSHYSERGATALDDIDGDLSSNIVIDSSDVDVDVLGTYTVTYTVVDAAGNVGQVTRAVLVSNTPDTTLPTITLNGDTQLITLSLGETYTELGATAQDNIDGDITSSITIDSSAVDDTIPGIYTVIYSVTDQSGNTITESRIVTVIEGPGGNNVAPLLTLVGDNPQTIALDSPYIEHGALAAHWSTGADITSNIIINSSTVDTRTAGTYEVTYLIMQNGNSGVGFKKRTVIVAAQNDVIPPVITLTGDQPQVIALGDPYTELGATALDDTDGDLSSNIVIDSSAVNTTLPGTYQVTYDVSDAGGNAVQGVRVVIVPGTNSGSITFDAGTEFDAALDGVTSVQIADIDNDGLNDISVFNGEVGNEELAWYRAPNWEKFDFSVVKPGPFVGHSAIADINDDGLLDVVIPEDQQASQNHVGNVYLYINPGRGSTGQWPRTTIGTYADALHIGGIAVADMDNDGKKDVIFRSIFDIPHVRIAFQNTPTSWTTRTIDTRMREGLSVHDMDNDGIQDIMLNGFWWRGPANWRTDTFTEYVIDDAYHSQTSGNSLDNSTKQGHGDFNGDGRDDVLITVAEGSGGDVAWYEAPVDPYASTWIKHTIETFVTGYHQAQVYDIDSDGDLDIMTGVSNALSPGILESVRVYQNDGTGSFTMHVITSEHGSYYGVVGDLDADGDLDILAPNDTGGTNPVYLYENLLN